MSRIGFAASRNLSIQIIEKLYKLSSNYGVEMVGGVLPMYGNSIDKELLNLYERLGIKVYSNITELIEQARPDILFSLNYWKLIDENDIHKVPKGIINIHHSYKLRYRGRYSTSWAIFNARKHNYWWHGTTLHYINAQLDDGNIIDTRKCRILESDTAGILFARVEELAIGMFFENLSKVLSGVSEFKSKDEHTYFYGNNSNKNMQIEDLSDIEKIYDFVRAWTFPGKPLPFIKFKQFKIKLSLHCGSFAKK